MKRPLQIVHVTLGLDMGGQEKLLVEFAQHADRDRVALHFVSLTSRGVLAEQLQAHGWSVTALEAPQGLRPGLVRQLAGLFRQLHADVIHTHDDRPNIHAAPAAWLAGLPCLHTRHHQGAHLSRRQRWLVRAASWCNIRFVCISHDSAAWAARQGIARHRLLVIHNGIDLSRFSYQGPTRNGYVVTVARLSAEKSLHTLLDAVALVTREQVSFQLRIAGDGPCRASLEQQAQRLGIQRHVHFLGQIHHVPELLAGARLFVLPSRTEGISLTLLEAMARGLPVVACRVGGNPEVVAEEQTGILVPAENPKELAQALFRLWTQPDLCATMGMAGRRRVEELFDVRRMVAEYEKLYHQVARSSR